jgi:hypothetical protein
MKKLSLLLTLFCLFGCRGPLEATQTIVRINATESMQARIKMVKTQIIGLTNGENFSDDPPEAPIWPMKWTLVPASASSEHRFKFLFTGLDEASMPVTQLELQAEVVEGASRYLYVLVSDDCLTMRCKDGVCRTVVPAAALRTSAAQAAELEVGCMGGSLVEPPATMTGSGPAISSGDGGVTKPPTATQTMMNAATMAGSAGAGANNGSNVPVGTAGKPDSGTVAPASTDAECRNNPCAPNGTCHLNNALPKKYECTCEAGFEPDATGATCVERNDCSKDNGGCEDHCERDALGAAVCSCTSADSWLKTDRKQCGKAQAEQALGSATGSVDRTRPQVAFDPLGNGVVAWTETNDAGVHSLWTARYDALSKSWQLPSGPFLRYTTEAADLHLALDANGSGVLLWTATVEMHRQLWAAVYRNNMFNLPPVPIAAETDSDALMPSLALDPSGDGLVVWTHAVYPKSSVRAASYTAGNAAFSRMQNTTDEFDSFVFGTSVALNSSIGGLVAWTRVPVNTNADGGIDFQVTSSSAVNTRVAGIVKAGEAFVTSKYPSSSPDVVLDAQGQGFAVWLQATSDAVDKLNVVSREYAPNVGWTKHPVQTLSDRGGVWSTPRVVMGPDGSAFTTWRESLGTAASGGPASLLTRGALRTADKFGTDYELGLPSDVTTWSDVDPAALTPESAVTLFDGFQPTWTTAVGPDHTGFIAGASFSTSSSPATRQLWLQRMAPDQAPSEPVLISEGDSVPSRPSPVKLGLNANGDGAVVWDRQINGHYHVFVSLLE